MTIISKIYSFCFGTNIKNDFVEENVHIEREKKREEKRITSATEAVRGEDRETGGKWGHW